MQCLPSNSKCYNNCCKNYDKIYSIFSIFHVCPAVPIITVIFYQCTFYKLHLGHSFSLGQSVIKSPRILVIFTKVFFSCLDIINISTEQSLLSVTRVRARSKTKSFSSREPRLFRVSTDLSLKIHFQRVGPPRFANIRRWPGSRFNIRPPRVFVALRGRASGPQLHRPARVFLNRSRRPMLTQLKRGGASLRIGDTLVPPRTLLKSIQAGVPARPASPISRAASGDSPSASPRGERLHPPLQLNPCSLSVLGKVCGKSWYVMEVGNFVDLMLEPTQSTSAS